MFIHNLKLGSLAAKTSRRNSLRRELEPFSHYRAHDEHQRRVEKFLQRDKKDP